MKRRHPGHLGEVLAAHPRWSPRSIQVRLTGCRRFVRWARRARVAISDFVEDMISAMTRAGGQAPSNVSRSLRARFRATASSFPGPSGAGLPADPCWASRPTGARSIRTTADGTQVGEFGALVHNL